LLYAWRKQLLTAAMTALAAVEVTPELQAPPVLPARAHHEAAEIDRTDGTRVKVGNGASAAVLCNCLPP
jgi:hypothetical protein